MADEARKIFVAGHNGMVGSAIVRQLAKGNASILTVDRAEVDLRDQAKVFAWMEQARPDAVILAAAKVGGIWANDAFPAEFIYENLIIEANIIHGSHLCGIDRLVFLGSSCIYPKLAEQPIREEALLSGPLEPTNEWYAVAKIAGIKLCQAYSKQYGRRYISVIPCNLYGPNDNFDLKSSHVLPALIRKFHEAKVQSASHVEIWGSGTPLREFLHVDDLAAAIVFLLDHYEGSEPINAGAGTDLSILELAQIICEVIGYKGSLVFDRTKPDGTPRKLMDSRRIYALGWKPRIELKDGIAGCYRWYVATLAEN
jgi:GDP-L-fucose synthase